MPIGTDINYAAYLLSNGELVAIPTETVYGLAANAFDKNAVAKIFETKNRPAFNPLIVHIKNIDYLPKIAKNVNEQLLYLFQKFSPGPLTILTEKKNIIPDIVTAGSNKVAIRIPRHPLTLQLLNKLNFPLAAPSANPFQYISPTSAQQVEEQLGDKIPYILDGGKCEIGLESTIIGVENNEIVIYRLGGISLEDIQNTIGKIKIKSNIKNEKKVKTPGQLSKHYSPKKPLFIGITEQLLRNNSHKKIALITFGKNKISETNKLKVYNLSEKADMKEAAANLFETLYEIDNSDAEIIIAELLPDTGLGRAINDRLIRASISKKF